MKLVFVLVRVDSLYYSLLSGIYVSLMANLTTTVFASETLPPKTQRLLGAALVSFLSAVAWIVVSWHIGRIRAQGSQLAATGIDPDHALMQLIKSRWTRIGFTFIGAVVFSILSFVILIGKGRLG